MIGISFRLPFAVSTAFGGAMMREDVDLPLYVTTGLYAIGSTAFRAFFRNMPERRQGPVPAKSEPAE